MPQWVWLDSIHRYRDLESGRFIGSEQVQAWSIQAATASGDVAVEYSFMLGRGELSVADWTMLMRRELKDVYIQQYVLGRGGLGQMTQRDWGSIGGMLRDQYRYLDGFARDIAAGRLTAGQVARRARMYTNSALEARSRAYVRALRMPDLPDHPGSGNTLCLTNCRCEWEIEEVKDDAGNVLRWLCTWRLNPAEHCTSTEMDSQGRPLGCVERAALWNPLVLEAQP